MATLRANSCSSVILPNPVAGESVVQQRESVQTAAAAQETSFRCSQPSSPSPYPRDFCLCHQYINTRLHKSSASPSSSPALLSESEPQLWGVLWSDSEENPKLKRVLLFEHSTPHRDFISFGFTSHCTFPMPEQACCELPFASGCTTGALPRAHNEPGSSCTVPSMRNPPKKKNNSKRQPEAVKRHF